MSPKWTSYVVSNPQSGLQNAKTAVYDFKSHFDWRNSTKKFLCVKTVSDKVEVHLLAELYVQKWLVGNVPLNLNFVLI